MPNNLTIEQIPQVNTAFNDIDNLQESYVNRRQIISNKDNALTRALQITEKEEETNIDTSLKSTEPISTNAVSDLSELSPLERALMEEKQKPIEPIAKDNFDKIFQEEEQGFFGAVGETITDIGKGAVSGAIEAGEELVKTGKEAAFKVAEYVPFVNFAVKNLPIEEAVDKMAYDNVGKYVDQFQKENLDTGSITNQLSKGVSQFLVGFASSGKLLKGMNVTGKAAKYGKVMLQGAIADFAFFDPQEERLSNLVQEFPALQNPITEFLQASPEDSQAMGRFKNVLEGAGLGILTDGFINAVKGIKQGRGAKKVLQEAGQEAVQKEIQQMGGDIFSDMPAKQIYGNAEKPLISSTKKTLEDIRIKEIPTEESIAFVRLQPEMSNKAVNINLSKLETTEDIDDLIRKTGQMFASDIDEARRGTISFEETQRLAETLGMTPEKLLSRRQGQAFNAEEALAARQILVSSAENLNNFSKELMQKKVMGTITDNDKVAFKQALSVHRAIQQQVSGIQAESGRALNAAKIKAKSQKEQIEAVKNLLDSDQSLDDIMEAMSSIDDPIKASQFAAKVANATTADIVYEAWINLGLLSGPTTQMANIAGNALVTCFQIPERFLGGVFSKLTGSDAIQLEEAKYMIYGLMNGFSDGWKMAKEAFKTEGLSDPLTKIAGVDRRAITAENISNTLIGKKVINPVLKKTGFKALDEGGMAAQFADFVGSGVRFMGTRMLSAEDAFFKGLNYRMEVHASAFRQAVSEGLEGDDLARRITDLITDPPESIRMSSMNQANINTFTNPNKIASAVSNVSRNFPPLKYVIPFIKTPTNILNYGFERTPLAPLSKAVRADLMAGGARREMAMAKIATGTGMMMAGSLLKTQGIITGGGPADPQLRQIWMQENQPYSVKVGDKFYSYNRFEPLGMFLGLAADFTDISGELDDNEADETAAAIFLSLSKNITSKSFLKGFADFNAAITNEKAGKRYLKNMASTIVPNFLNQINKSYFDNTLRDAETFMDSIKAKIPSYSKDLPPRRNIWGEPIVLEGGLGPDIMSPIYTKTKANNPINEEILRNKIEISMPNRSIGGVKLNNIEYSRYVELAGNAAKAPDGKGAKDKLIEIIQTPMYKNLTDGADGSKGILIKGMISTYRTLAQKQLLQEFPELSEKVIGKKMGKIQAIRGVQ